MLKRFLDRTDVAHGAQPDISPLFALNNDLDRQGTRAVLSDCGVVAASRLAISLAGLDKWKKPLHRVAIISVGLLAWTTGSAVAQGAGSEGRPDAGAVVFKKCMACHQVGPSARNGIGPVLNGVVGRPAGQYPNYNYSSANKNSGLVWDEPTLTRYLRAPAKVVPGTKMIFSGLKKDREISDVIAYLKQFSPDGKQVSR